jgi:hypothetical protein
MMVVVVVMVSTRTLFIITTTPRARTVLGALFMLVMALDAMLIAAAIEPLAITFFLSIARILKLVIARLWSTIAGRGLSVHI